jgi:hypothetical protein
MTKASSRSRTPKPGPDVLGDDPALRNLIAKTAPPPLPPGAATTHAPAAAGLTSTGAPVPAGPSASADPGSSPYLRPVPQDWPSLPAQAPVPAAPTTSETALGDPPVEDDLPGTIQATVQLSRDVASRLRRFQQQAAGKGTTLDNGDIVFSALNWATGRYREIVADHQPKPAPGQLFGAPVRGRRRNTQAEPRLQFSFRPTPQEKARIRQLAKDTGAGSMNTFVDYVLDAFLTAHGLPRGKRTAQP